MRTCKRLCPPPCDSRAILHPLALLFPFTPREPPYQARRLRTSRWSVVLGSEHLGFVVATAEKETTGLSKARGTSFCNLDPCAGQELHRTTVVLVLSGLNESVRPARPPQT